MPLLHPPPGCQQVDSTEGVEAGDWLRLWVKSPSASSHPVAAAAAGGSAEEPAPRRALLAAAAGKKAEADSQAADSKPKAGSEPKADAKKPKPAAAEADAKPEQPPKLVAASVQKPGAAQEEPSLASLLFDEPDLQEGLAAAFEAQVAAQRAAQKARTLLGAGAGEGAWAVGRRVPLRPSCLMRVAFTIVCLPHTCPAAPV